MLASNADADAPCVVSEQPNRILLPSFCGMFGSFVLMRIQLRLACLVLSVAAMIASAAHASSVDVFYSFRGVDLEINQYPDISVNLTDTSSDLGSYSEFFRADVSRTSVTVNSFVSLDSMVGPNGIFASGTAEALIELQGLEPQWTSSLVTSLLDVAFEVKEPVPYELSASILGSFTSERPADLHAEVVLYGPGGFLVGVAGRDGVHSVSESGILEPGIYNLQAGAIVRADAVFFDEGSGGSVSYDMSLVVPEGSTGLYFGLLICIAVLCRLPTSHHF